MGKQKNNKFEPKTNNVYKYNTPINREQTFTRRNVYNYNEFTRSAYNAYSPYRRNQVYGTYSRSSNIHPSNVRHFRKKPLRKLPSRPTSPALGSEEYMVRKIKQTSAIIMEQLLNPDKHDAITTQDHESEDSRVECNKSIEQNPISEKSNSSLNSANKNKKISTYNIEEIHKKIVTHITKLNDGRKKNLINSNISGYDVAIQQIQKQKRLEISRALRDMCSQSRQTQESNDFINSIIPDMGIKIEDLSPELIEELRNNLDLDLDCFVGIDDSFSTISKDQDSFALDKCDELMEQIYEPVHEDPKENRFPENVYTSLSNWEGKLETSSPCLEQGSSPRYDSCTSSSIKTYEHIGKIDSSPHGSSSTSGIDEEGFKNIGRSNCSDSEITIEKEIFPHIDIPYDELLTSLQTNNSTNDSKFEYINVNEGKPNVVEIKKEICDYPETDELPGISDTLLTYVDKVDVTDTCINTTERENGDISSDVVAEIKKENCVYSETDKLLENCDKLQTSVSNNIDVTDTSVIKTENECDGILRETACQYKDESISESILRCSIGTQTEEERDSCTANSRNTADSYFKSFVKEYFKEAPDSTADAIRKMLEIDEYISSLTKCRQALFDNFKKPGECTDNRKATKKLPYSDTLHSAPDLEVKESTKKIRMRKRKLYSYCLENSDVASFEERIKSGRRWRKRVKKRKFVSSNPRSNSEAITHDEGTTSLEIRNDGLHDKEEESSGLSNRVSEEALQKKIPQNLLEIADVHEKILVIKVMEDKLVAAAESGKIFFCSLDDGHFTKVLTVINVPVISLLFIRTEQGEAHLYVGSYEKYLQVYNFHNQCLLKTIPIEDSVQCMESKWGYIFIGCIRGTLLRYSIKKQMMEYEDRFTGNSILVLKATQEGARRILIVGSRNSPVCIRDAMTGLFMRTLYERNVVSPTVYSLVMENSLVYCGTANHDILIFNFNDGTLIHTFKADSRGIGCMKIMNNLLFASCHNGNIYVYDTKTNGFVGSIAGPGGVILSMEVMENQIIVGTMSFKFKSIPIPAHIKSY